MRVLHVIPAVAPRYGGPSQAVIEMCLTLQRDGIDAELCATNADGSGHLDVDIDKPTSYRGVPAHFFRRDWSEAFKFSRSLDRWLERHIAGYDIVHIHAVFSHATHAAARACRRHHVPYIVRPLGTLEPWSMQQKRPRKLLAWHFFFRRVLHEASAVHYTTEQERELTERSLGLNGGIVIPNGVDEKLLEVQTSGKFRQQHGIPADAPFVLSLSRLHPKKGIDLLLKAFVDLKAQGKLAEWHLVVAGDGETDYVEGLRKIVLGTSVQPIVHWVGWLEGATKFEALAEADLFVLSSLQENFGIGPVESMACGSPVLLSRQVGLASDVRKAGAGWVIDLDAAGLRDGLAQATGNPMELATRGAAARELVRERFTWSRIAGEWAVLYEKLSLKKAACCCS
ncbi:MAG TPA: glycosyltransferase [Verrucomicrobiae bacterium]|nr:glycosyltransferase [Verrucomicrobiae bacterium]